MIEPIAILRFAFRWMRRFSILLVVLAMLALNVASLAFAPLAAAAGSMLARAGITSVADARARDLETVKKQLASQADELATARARTASQADELASLKRRMASQADELTSAKGQLARQGDELAALRHVRYRGASHTIGEAVSDTAERISRRTVTATARNFAAMPAEAVPLFGIAVIAGATAWELKDACELMQDVHELNVAFNPTLAKSDGRYEACGFEVPTRGELWQRMLIDPQDALSKQPEEYGDLPTFEEPGWWAWAMSWFGREVDVSGMESAGVAVSP